MHSDSARFGVCTNQGILCPVLLDALASVPIRVELYTTVLYVLASVRTSWMYAQRSWTSWRLHQSGGNMHYVAARVAVCTNQGTVFTVIPDLLESVPI